jgi:hypothetical protein
VLWPTSPAPAFDVTSYDAIVDFDGDRRPDATSSGLVILDLMSGSSPFAMPRPIPRTSANAPRRFADLDGDGATDMLMACTTGAARRYDAVHLRGANGTATAEATPLGYDIKNGNGQLFADVNGVQLLEAGRRRFQSEQREAVWRWNRDCGPGPQRENERKTHHSG